MNLISPELIQIKIFKNFENNEEENTKILNEMKTSRPINHFGQPNEIAKSVLFLPSNDSIIYITAIELFIDRGQGQISTNQF